MHYFDAEARVTLTPHFKKKTFHLPNRRMDKSVSGQPVGPNYHQTLEANHRKKPLMY
jgi:hypothetical protein